MGRPVGQTNMQPAAAASEQTAASAVSSSEQQQAVSQPADSRVVLRGVALLYESPGGNQVDGLPPVPTLEFQSSIQGYKLNGLGSLAPLKGSSQWCEALSSVSRFSGGPSGSKASLTH